MIHAEERAAVAAGCRRLVTDGLVVGTSGNVSVRVGDAVAISPSGVPYDVCEPDAVCLIDLDGRPLDGTFVPSSEWRMHTQVYRARPDVGAVVHAHPVATTAVSTLAEEVPPIHYLLAGLGGRVHVAPYATYGSAELAEHSVAGLADRGAVVLANHGATTVGTTLAHAHERMMVLDWVCAVWLAARAGGTPRLLDGAELERVAERLRAYGQPDPSP
jgi:L-fuculose-phosphate aldolase